MSSPNPIRVLHVDDDADFLEVTKQYLEQNERLSVETEADPVAGLERAPEFDCVIIDYKMGKVDGLTFLKELRESHSMPVLFFTGAGSEEVASEAIGLGVTDYLQKSMSLEDFQILANRLEIFVDKQRAEQAAAAADQQVRDVYERITVAFFAVDEEWQFSFLNDPAEALFGVDESEVLGRTLWETFPELQGSDAETHIRASIAEQQPGSCEAELPSLEKYVAMHAYPDESGVSMFVEDITELRKQEAELEELRSELEITEEQFRTLRQKVDRVPSPFRR